MRTLLVVLLLAWPALAQPLTLRLGAPVSFSGAVEKSPDGRVWLRTAQGERVLVNNELGFTDADHQLLDYATLIPGSAVTAELAAGELRLVAVREGVVTLVGAGGPVQVPLARLAPVARSEVPVRLLVADGSSVTLPLPQALQQQVAGLGTVQLPELGLATLATDKGTLLINLKPELRFTEPLKIAATLQNRTARTLHMVARSSGDSLAAPQDMCQPAEPKPGDAVQVEIPAASYQLVGMFGRQAQINTPCGRLQLPFRLLPENVLDSTNVWVRTFGGEVRELTLRQALKEEKTESYMVLLPGAPGINPSEVSGFYDIRP